MRVKVLPLRQGGKRVAKLQRQPPVAGVLEVIHAPYGHGMARLAYVKQPTEASSAVTVLGPLIDPALIASGADSILLKGLSCEGECEMVQEWWIQVTPQP